jgi:glycosyltransferase involved in cell wall biosynthesis
MCNAHVNYLEDAYEILGSYGVGKRKIFITYNSPDTDILLNAFKEARLSEPILPENKHRLIHVGRLVKWKKADLLIDAVARLKNKYPDLELVVIGDGPQLEDLKIQAANLALESSVLFVGGVYDPVFLGKYFIASSVYVLAGMGGLSINEAMCFNKPVVCSVCDGTEKKLVREDYNGKYFKDSNLDDLVQKLDYLLANPELIKQMGFNSGEIIKKEVNIHKVISGYVNAFNYVMKDNIKLKYEPS